MDQELKQLLQKLNPVICFLNVPIQYFFREKLSHYQSRTACRLSTLLDPRYEKKAFRFSTDFDHAVRVLRSNTVADQLKTIVSVVQENDIPSPKSKTGCNDSLSFLDDNDEREHMPQTVSATAESIIRTDSYLRAERISRDNCPLEY